MRAAVLTVLLAAASGCASTPATAVSGAPEPAPEDPNAPPRSLPEPTPAPARPSFKCHDCEEWNQPVEPFAIHGNTSYVGVAGLSAILVNTSAGLVLLDGALPQSVDRISDNIRRLGFEPSSLKWILNSHAHFDHAGGIETLRQRSGARVGVSVEGAKALRIGSATPDDPQAGLGAFMDYPRVTEFVPMKDGETIRLGDVTFTLHFTPGHAPGSTSWTWTSCEGAACVQIAYVDSLTAVSADGFSFSDDPARVATFRETLRKVRALPCDLLLTPHPGASGLFERRDAGTFVQLDGCVAYADRAEKALDARLEREKAERAQ